MTRARQDMQDVVLVEVDGLGTEADPPALARALPDDVRTSSSGVVGSPTTTPGRVGALRAGGLRGGGLRGGGLRPGRLWPLGVVLALVAGAGVLDGRREAAGLAELADQPYALAPVDGPVTELWRSSDLFLHGFDVVSDLLVGAGQRTSGEVVAVGLDPRTGAERWTTPLAPDGRRTGGATCQTPDAPRGGGGGAADAADRATVCVVVDEVGPVDDFSPAGVMQPSVSRFLVLDPATGRVLREDPIAASTSVAPLGADLVLSHLDDGGRLVVRRTDGRGDEVRWSFTSPEPLEATEYGRWAWVTVVDDLVLAGGESGWVLSADGRPLHSWQPSPRGSGWVDVLGNGLLLQPATGDGLATDVIDLRTSGSFRLPGRPVHAPVDDGSADAVLAQMTGDRLAAFDVATGRPLWSVPDAGTGGSGLLVVGGRVVRTQDDGLAALDAVTGETLWTTPVQALPQYTLLTDGRLVLCVETRPERGQVLGAYGIDDGRLRWDVDLPDGVDHLFVVDGALFGYAQTGLVAFG